MAKGAWQVTVRGVTRVKHNLPTKPPPSKTQFLTFSSLPTLSFYYQSPDTQPVSPQSCHTLRKNYYHLPSSHTSKEGITLYSFLCLSCPRSCLLASALDSISKVQPESINFSLSLFDHQLKTQHHPWSGQLL